MRVTALPKECPDCECALQRVMEANGRGGFEPVLRCPWFLPAATPQIYEVGGQKVAPCGKPYARSSRVF